MRIQIILENIYTIYIAMIAQNTSRDTDRKALLSVLRLAEVCPPSVFELLPQTLVDLHFRLIADSEKLHKRVVIMALFQHFEEFLTLGMSTGFRGGSRVHGDSEKTNKTRTGRGESCEQRIGLRHRFALLFFTSDPSHCFVLRPLSPTVCLCSTQPFHPLYPPTCFSQACYDR